MVLTVVRVVVCWLFQLLSLRLAGVGVVGSVYVTASCSLAAWSWAGWPAARCSVGRRTCDRGADERPPGGCCRRFLVSACVGGCGTACRARAVRNGRQRGGARPRTKNVGCSRVAKDKGKRQRYPSQGPKVEDEAGSRGEHGDRVGHTSLRGDDGGTTALAGRQKRIAAAEEGTRAARGAKPGGGRHRAGRRESTGVVRRSGRSRWWARRGRGNSWPLVAKRAERGGEREPLLPV